MAATFNAVADELAANGYLPVPLIPHSKRPAIEAWEKYEHGRSPLPKIHQQAGCGILCGLVRGVDIDVMRIDLAAELRAHAEAVWGSLPARIGQAPKVMLLCRTVRPGAKLRSIAVRFPDDPPGAKPHAVEILGAGQQFVAYGEHPDTRLPYTWNGAGEPLQVPLEQLPVATEEELYGFLQWVNNRLIEAGGVPCGKLAKQDTEQRTSNDELAAHDPDECAQAIAAIANDDLHWDDWVYVGLAIKGALGDAGLTAWHEFSRRSAKYDPELTSRQYASFNPERIGAGTLYRLAFDAGWQRPTYDVDISGLLRNDKQPTPLLLDYTGLQRAVGPLSWLVKGVIPANSIGSLYGGPASFKSFILLDAALHVAHALQWLGLRTKQGGVVYVAAEGGTGLLARIDAWHRKYQRDPRAAPFRACITPLTLDKAVDLKRLVDAVDAQLDALGSVAMVVLDTMSQTMSGDENEARDTAAYLRAIGGAIRARYGCAVVVVHHTGKDVSRGPRGSSAIRGNLDFLLEVDRPEGQMVASMTVRKQKDGRDGECYPFAMDRVELGTDEDGDPITSLVAAHHDAVAAVLATAAERNTKYEAWLLEIVGSGKLYGDSRNQFYEKCGNASADTKKKAFARAIKSLLESRQLVERNNCLFPRGEP